MKDKQNKNKRCVRCGNFMDVYLTNIGVGMDSGYCSDCYFDVVNDVNADGEWLIDKELKD